MNRRIVLLGSLILIVVAVVAIKILGSGEQPQQVAEEEPLQIMIAARNLPAGTLIKEDDLQWQKWPPEAQTASMVANTEYELASFLGTVVRSGVREGEPVMKNSVLRPGEKGFLAVVLQPGMRAISVKLTPVTGVAGLIFPGDRVDVILTHLVDVPKTDGGVTTRRLSETVVTNARVLALDQKIDDQAKEPKLADVATLEVTPKDAEKVALMADWGTLALVLRSVLTEERAAGEAANASGETAEDVISGLLIPETALQGGGKDRTWDSDVSNVLPTPKLIIRRVQVLRGSETGEMTFEQR
ncbi:MAG: Flp pilus assembly protein CpaB [Alphaproteobacteria bacterium]|nr:Flp pilus assembly protein CpaB [Alphaproteobacteria bacterium]